MMNAAIKILPAPPPRWDPFPPPPPSHCERSAQGLKVVVVVVERGTPELHPAQMESLAPLSRSCDNKPHLFAERTEFEFITFFCSYPSLIAPERSKRESFSFGRDFASLVLADAQSAIIRTHRSRNRELENNSFPTLYVSQYLLLLETNTFRNVKKIKVEENGSQEHTHSFFAVYTTCA